MVVTPVIVSLGLFLGALGLAVTSAALLAVFARALGEWFRWPAALLGKAAALFPLSAVVWAAIGLWVGQWGRPIGSLTVSADSAGGEEWMFRAAWEIWWWCPPLFLLALPVTFECFVRRMESRQPVHLQALYAGWLAIALLPVVEDCFNLPGLFAGIVPALHTPVSAPAGGVFWPLGAFAMGWWLLIMAWPRTPGVYLLDRETKICEGALAIGFRQDEVWKRHRLPNEIRRFLASALSFLATALELWVACGCPGDASRHQQLHTAFRAALNDPWAPLSAALPYALCALSLWLLGRIILPRQR